MRTTVELPPELMRAAKARSAESGESLKSLLTRAVAAELQLHDRRASSPKGKVTLPLFGGATSRPVRVSNADLERALADSDANMATAPRRERRAGRRSR